jgi:hypothetical protein
MMLGGVVEGLKQGRKFGFWTVLYFLLEEGIDRGRSKYLREFLEWRRNKLVRSDNEAGILENQRDALSSAFAGLGSAGLFSIYNRFPLPTMSRTMRMGAKAGLAFGLLQDGLSLLRGRRVGYIEAIKFYVFGLRKDAVLEVDPA